MPLTKEEISKMIMEAFPEATLELKDTMGDNNHYSAKIISKNFNGKSRVEQHKMVYKALKGKMGNELHALALTTEEKMSDINQKIKDIVSKNNIVLFMKGTPDAPQCGFSLAVSNILKHLNVKFEGVNVLVSDELRQGIKDYTDWPTIPQLYVNGEFVGGADIVKEMYEKGELKKLFEK